MDWGLDEGLVVFDLQDRPVDLMLACRKQRESIVAWKAYLGDSLAQLQWRIEENGENDLGDRACILDRIRTLEARIDREKVDLAQLEQGKIPDNWLLYY